MPERSPPDAAVDVLDVVTNAQNLQALLMRFFGYVNPAGDAFIYYWDRSRAMDLHDCAVHWRGDPRKW